MECVILFRNPSNGSVGYISDVKNEDSIAVFPDHTAALDLARGHFLLRSFPYQIVELDGL